MIRRPPRSTLDRSSAASDVYKRQGQKRVEEYKKNITKGKVQKYGGGNLESKSLVAVAVSYTHLRAHETVLDLVCRLLLENKKDTSQ